jgi:hypothetical protein
MKKGTGKGFMAKAESASGRKGSYVMTIVRGVCSLVRGLKVTFVEFFTRKTTVND